MTSKTLLSARIETLKAVPLFQGLAEAELRALARIGEEIVLAEGLLVYHLGDPGSALFVLGSGRVGFERPGEYRDSVSRIATLEAPAFFGEQTFLDGGPQVCDAIALEELRLLRLPAEPLRALLYRRPAIALELLKEITLRLRQAEEQISQHSHSTPRKLQNLWDKL